ncbi:hypothetical protein ACRRTK_006638 [Alexandromys fortis]
MGAKNHWAKSAGKQEVSTVFSSNLAYFFKVRARASGLFPPLLGILPFLGVLFLFSESGLYLHSMPNLKGMSFLHPLLVAARILTSSVPVCKSL